MLRNPCNQAVDIKLACVVGVYVQILDDCRSSGPSGSDQHRVPSHRQTLSNEGEACPSTLDSANPEMYSSSSKL